MTKRNRRALEIICVFLPVLVFFAPLLKDAFSLVGTPCFRTGDFPLILIWVQNAQGFDSLSGQYSRLGFHHPGPLMAYLYVAGSSLLGEEIPTYRGIEFVQLFMNALLMGISLGAVFRISKHLWAPTILLFVSIMFFQLSKLSVLHDPWAPSVIMVPTLCIMLSTALIASRHFQYFLPWALSAAILLSSHLGTLPLVAGLGMFTALSLWLQKKEIKFAALPKTVLLLSVAFLTSTTVPVVIDLLNNEGGNLQRIFNYLVSPSSSKIGLASSLTVISQYIFPGLNEEYLLSIFVFIFISGCALFIKKHRNLSTTLLVSFLLFVFSFAQVTGAAHPYIFWFFASFAALFWFFVLLLILELIPRGKTLHVGLFSLCLLSLAALWVKQEEFSADGCLIPDAKGYEQAIRQAGSKDSLIYLRQRGNHFPDLANLYLKLREDGRKVCIARGAIFFLDKSNACPSSWREAHTEESFIGYTIYSRERMPDGVLPDLLIDDIAIVIDRH